jgi:serine protease AprX
LEAAMTPDTDDFDFDLFERQFVPVSTAATGASRVWRAPAIDRQPGRSARLAAIVATAAVIAGGAVGIAALDGSPSPAVEAPTSQGSMYHVVDQIGARDLWSRGITGAGVNVAVIDTGIADVEAFSSPGKVRAAVDLTSERSDPSSAFVDSYGHGTHLAGIIAGRTPGSVPADSAQHPEWFMGVAPDAGLVSVKVAGRDGAVTREQMVTGIDWVVAHADQLDIGVLTVAFDTGTASSYVNDPLAAALERAWNAGIVVVTAAGNGGSDSGALSAPANAPFVIATGGVEVGRDGVTVADWTSSGDGVRNPDLAAPGAHIESLRAPGSTADVDHPEGLVDDQLFLGSGSSQSAAVTAGVAALVRSARPDLTPDQIKRLLIDTATPIDGGSADRIGSGVVNAVAAVAAPASSAPQEWQPTDAIGTAHVAGAVTIANPGELTSSSWASSSWASSSWASSSWASSSWASSSWASSSWASSSWASSSWASSSWA